MSLGVAGCGEDPRPAGTESVEAMLREQMTERLDGLRVSDVDCVYLTPIRTRCFARGSGPAGPFELPVSVGERSGRPVWSVVKQDLREAAADERTPLPALGERVVILGRDGERIIVAVESLTDPLEGVGQAAGAQRGGRHVGLRVRLRNRGSRRFVDSPQSRISLTLSNGELVAPTFVGQGPCQTLSLLEVELAPGEQVRGCVAFKVPEGAAPARLALEVGSNRRVYQWSLEGGGARRRESTR